DLGRADADTHVRHLASAQDLESGAVVFVVAQSDDAAGLDLVEQLGQGRALAGERRVYLDDLAALRAIEPGVLEERTQKRHRLLAGDLRVAEMNGRGGGLDLEASTGHRSHQLG